jgi:hypothetical protein
MQEATSNTVRRQRYRVPDLWLWNERLLDLNPSSGVPVTWFGGRIKWRRSES